MQIQINTDHNIEGHQRLADHVRGIVEAALSRFTDRITRVEVHLSDENGDKHGGDDKRCMVEVRLAGRRPTVAIHHAETIDEAVGGATDKLKRSIENTLSRLEDSRS